MSISTSSRSFNPSALQSSLKNDKERTRRIDQVNAKTRRAVQRLREAGALDRLYGWVRTSMSIGNLPADASDADIATRERAILETQRIARQAEDAASGLTAASSAAGLSPELAELESERQALIVILTKDDKAGITAYEMGRKGVAWMVDRLERPLDDQPTGGDVRGVRTAITCVRAYLRDNRPAATVTPASAPAIMPVAPMSESAARVLAELAQANSRVRAPQAPRSFGTKGPKSGKGATEEQLKRKRDRSQRDRAARLQSKTPKQGGGQPGRSQQGAEGRKNQNKG